jgi:hypothetical protein
LQYDITYLAAGQRQTTHVEAPDAAAAVAIVEAERGHRPPAFELLSVIPAPDVAAPHEACAD